jgi:hypothetical protein
MTSLADYGILSVENNSDLNYDSWKTGVYAFDDVTLNLLTDVLLKGSDTTVVIDDHDIKYQSYSGIFESTRPRAALQQVLTSMDAAIQNRDGAYYLNRKNKSVSAQCDPELFEAMEKTPSSLKMLKRYSISVREVEGAPFATQYSYVFTKGTQYVFNLKESVINVHRLFFTLTDNEGKVLNSTLRTIVYEGDSLLAFECRKTGIFYLQLSYYDEAPVLNPSDIAFESQFADKEFENQRELKQYQIDGKKRIEFSYVLTSKNYYAIYIERKDQLTTGIKFDIRNSDRKQVNAGIAKFNLPQGMLYTIRCKKTGIFYFSFEIADDVVAFARLSKIENVNE